MRKNRHYIYALYAALAVSLALFGYHLWQGAPLGLAGAKAALAVVVWGPLLVVAIRILPAPRA